MPATPVPGYYCPLGKEINAMNDKTAARLIVILHDLFVFASLVYTVASFFLRATVPYEDRHPIWVAAVLLWMAFCLWSAVRTVASLIRGGGKRTANFVASLERSRQDPDRMGFGGFMAITLIIGVLRLAIPTVLWLL